MGQEQRLFQAVLEEPENLDLRLVFADWYQEQGDPRAEFIQVQIALDRLPRQHVWREDLEKRERELFNEHRREWNAPIHRHFNQSDLKGKLATRRGLFRGWEYRRGFVEHLTIDAQAIMESYSLFDSVGPIRSLKVVNLEPCLEAFCHWPQLSKFRILDLSFNHIGDENLPHLLSSPYLSQLRELRMINVGLSVQSVKQLIETKTFENLEMLVLSQNSFSAHEWQELLFRFGSVLVHENGNSPLTTFLTRSINDEPEFQSYDDDILYEEGRADTEGKRQLDGEWVEGYDEYEGFEAFDEDGLKELGGYENADRSEGWIGRQKRADDWNPPPDWEDSAY